MLNKILHWQRLYLVRDGDDTKWKLLTRRTQKIAVVLYNAIPDQEVYGYQVPRCRRTEPGNYAVMDGTFPKTMPQWFKTRYGRPIGGSKIASWLFKNDAPVSPQQNLFRQTVAEWKKRKFE